VRRRPGPDPDESPSLVPPRRNPPTAVATATPPPPARDPHYPRGMNRVQRISAGLLGAVGVTAGVALATLPGLGLVFGPLLAGVGADALCRGFAGRGVMAQSRAWRRKRNQRRAVARAARHTPAA